MFRLNPFVRVGLCLSAISCAWPVLAVDDDGETMVVTASSVEQNLKDAPASISVITQEDLQRKPVQNLKDVLKEVPGVQLTNEGDNRCLLYTSPRAKRNSGDRQTLYRSSESQ